MMQQWSFEGAPVPVRYSRLANVWQLSVGTVDADEDLAEVFAIRRKVFVQEQGVLAWEKSYGEDFEAVHVAARGGGAHGGRR